MSSVVTIHSDGTPKGTSVVTDDGEVIPHVVEVDISMRTDGVAANIEIAKPSLVVKVSDVHFTWACPGCSEPVDHECNEGVDRCNKTYHDRLGITHICKMRASVVHFTHVDIDTGAFWKRND